MKYVGLAVRLKDCLFPGHYSAFFWAKCSNCIFSYSVYSTVEIASAPSSLHQLAPACTSLYQLAPFAPACTSLHHLHQLVPACTMQLSPVCPVGWSENSLPWVLTHVGTYIESFVSWFGERSKRKVCTHQRWKHRSLMCAQFTRQVSLMGLIA